jgi:hypothetical protein
MFAVLGRLGLNSGPKPSRKAIWQGDLVRERAQTRAGWNHMLTTLGLLLTVLGSSWGLCGRSGAENCEEHGYLEHVICGSVGGPGSLFGAHGGHLGPLLEPMLAVLGSS